VKKQQLRNWENHS